MERSLPLSKNSATPQVPPTGTVPCLPFWGTPRGSLHGWGVDVPVGACSVTLQCPSSTSRGLSSPAWGLSGAGSSPHILLRLPLFVWVPQGPESNSREHVQLSRPGACQPALLALGSGPLQVGGRAKWGRAPSCFCLRAGEDFRPVFPGSEIF